MPEGYQIMEEISTTPSSKLSRIEQKLASRASLVRYDSDLDLVRLLLQGHLGTEAQRAVVVRVIKQLRPAKSYTGKFYDSSGILPTEREEAINYQRPQFL